MTVTKAKAERIANKFKGNFEPLLAEQLDELKAYYEYEPYPLAYILKGNYWPDFVLSNGIHIEGKGHLDTAARRKLRAVKDQHPDLDLRIVFQRAQNKLSKGSTTTYGDWADRYGFKWADGVIPKEWTV